MIEESLAGGWPTGEYRDVLVEEHGRPVWVRDWQRNLIVDNLRKVLAALVKGDSQVTRLGYWTVGSGDPAWDSGTLPPDSSRRTHTGLPCSSRRTSRYSPVGHPPARLSSIMLPLLVVRS